MPKHAFRFPPEVINAVKQHVRNAIDKVPAKRYRQEANYTAALMGCLNGTAYDGKYGSIIFTSTVFDDRGRNSAESRYGADHAITATVSDGEIIIQKVILVQAKLGRVADMKGKNVRFLKEQISKMK